MKGTYVLLIRMLHDVHLKVGGLGNVGFKAGHYAYVGSALGSLKKRVERHLREGKRKHWHVDYLLAETDISEVVYGKSKKRKECEVARNLAENLKSFQGFGSSDCDCESHLFYSRSFDELKEHVFRSFEQAGLTPRLYSELADWGSSSKQN